MDVPHGYEKLIRHLIETGQSPDGMNEAQLRAKARQMKDFPKMFGNWANKTAKFPVGTASYLDDSLNFIGTPAAQSKRRTITAARKALGPASKVVSKAAPPLALAHAGYEIKEGLEDLAENPGTVLLVPAAKGLLKGQSPSETARRMGQEHRQDEYMKKRREGGPKVESKGRLGPSMDKS